MTAQTRKQENTGDVLHPMESCLDLRSFDPEFMKSFFPLDTLTQSYHPELLFGYADTRGDADLREALSRRIGLPPDHILITDGASQALFLSLLTGLEAGASVLTPRPAFPAYARMAAYRGCQARYYPCQPDAAGLRAALDSTSENSGSGLIINSPHNPTGAMLDRRALQECLEHASERGVFTIFDDTYHWMSGACDQLTNPLVGARAGMHAVTVVSLGKYLCMPGLRLGFLASPDRQLIDDMTEAKRHLSHASCPAHERLALRLLTSSDWARGRMELKAELERRRAIAEAGFRVHSARPAVPATGFYIYASGIEGLKRLKIAGIEGRIFAAGPDEARYCLAAGPERWQALTAALAAR
ncbi:MAG: pyridoxal phosphate-dependent aminotransferase [Oceanicaulis sp.]|nr:pyridoxal phosphate-dependent aminotransferase [Oceanicaulis sp.]